MENQRQHFWEGAVGISISTQLNRNTNDPFYTFELVRCFKRDGSEEMEYSHHFSQHHAPAIAKVIERGLDFMQKNPLKTESAHDSDES